MVVTEIMRRLGRDPLLVLVAGGTGSGKSYLAERWRFGVTGHRAYAATLSMDAYYRGDGSITNFDHPDAFDADLYLSHVRALLSGHAVDVPVYDFTTHRRSQEIHRQSPPSVLIVDGIFPLLERFAIPGALRVFVDAPADVRYTRRFVRDQMPGRARTPESIAEQWAGTVAPMHAAFVEPQRERADMVVENPIWLPPGYDRPLDLPTPLGK